MIHTRISYVILLLTNAKVRGFSFVDIYAICEWISSNKFKWFRSTRFFVLCGFTPICLNYNKGKGLWPKSSKSRHFLNRYENLFGNPWPIPWCTLMNEIRIEQAYRVIEKRTKKRAIIGDNWPDILNYFNCNIKLIMFQNFWVNTAY